MNLFMKTAQKVWLMIGVYIILQNGLTFVNGQDLIGIMVLAYTFTKIFNPKFSLKAFIISNFTV